MDNQTIRATGTTIAPGEILRMFLALGVLGFGGPPAHLALMERELVTRRGWITREMFLDMLAAINLVPGPNSTEMAIHIGYEVGGVRGMLLSGAGFILPAVFFSVILAMIYVSAGQVPAVQGLLVGMKPVILVLILSAGYRLARTAINNRVMLLLLIAACIVLLPGLTPVVQLFGIAPFIVPELAILLTCGVSYVLMRRSRPVAPVSMIGLVGVAPKIGGIGSLFLMTQTVAPTLFDFFWRFFVIGGTLFGSGLVLSSYMQRTFVDGLGWMTNQQLIDALAIGQSTPGPVLSTVAAAGYIISQNFAPGNVALGVLAGLMSAIGVFLPAFLVILLLGRVVPRIRKSAVAMDFLKGVNAAVIALLFGTFVNLAWTTLVRPGIGIDWLTLALTGGFFILSERYKWSALRLVIAGAVIGLLRAALLI
jgi:chromate transporter